MRRSRQRMGAVMKWAVAQGYRDDNPAGDAISAVLPKTVSVRKHRRVLPFAEVGEALHKVRASGTLSDNRISKLLRELGIKAVPHDLRSSFRDWAAECTDAPREVCELAPAHVNSNRVEAAYRRADLFERLRVLMDEWSGFVGRSARGGENRGGQ